MHHELAGRAVHVAGRRTTEEAEAALLHLAETARRLGATVTVSVDDRLSSLDNLLISVRTNIRNAARSDLVVTAEGNDARQLPDVLEARRLGIPVQTVAPRSPEAAIA